MKLPQNKTTDDGWIWFTPDFLSNLELPEEDRAAIEIQPFKGTELQALEKSHLLIPKKMRKESQIFKAALKREEDLKEEILSTRTRGAKKWFDEDNGVEVEITTFADLRKRLEAKVGIAAAVNALVNEVYQTIRGQSELDADLLGESKPVPASP